MHKKPVGTVIALYIATRDTKTPIQKSEIDVDTKGILTDKHYDKDINRSILITSTDSYDLVKAEDIDIDYSALGENLLIDYNPYDLPVGTELQLGTAVLSISQDCTLCGHLSCIDEAVPKILKNDRGVFAKVVQPGTIKKGDEIFLVN